MLPCFAKVAFPVALMLMAAPVMALTIEAGNARVRTAGAAMPGGWNLHSNGEVGDYVRAETAGTHTVLVRARGTPCKGVWPLMQVYVDGDPGASAFVDSKEFADYTLKAEIPAGVHLLTVAFLNDALEGGEDRNLFLDRIEISPVAGSKEVVLASREEWAAGGEAREEAALQRAAEGAEKYRKSDATVHVVDAAGRPVIDAVVHAELVDHEFLFGCNIFMFDRFKLPEQNAIYKKRFAELFNFATVGFYWRWYEPERGKPHYEETDKIVAWATEHGIRLKGHPLLWACEAGIPKWSEGQPAKDVQKARVEEIMKRYAGKIGYWEVVNEPAHLSGLPIDEPYRWARAAEEKAVLIVNDYYVLANGYPPFLKLLQGAKAAGVPFDGIGIQAHEPRAMRFPLEQVQKILDRYATVGVPLYITEFTPASGGQPITGSHRQGIWNETAQAEYTERFFRVIFGHPATAALTWWDLCEQGAWLPGGGLLRKDLSPKPAYDMVWRLVRREWRTVADGRTDGTGALGLRGFHGRYKVHVEFGGRKADVECRLARTGPNEWVVRLPG